MTWNTNGDWSCKRVFSKFFEQQNVNHVCWHPTVSARIKDAAQKRGFRMNIIAILKISAIWLIALWLIDNVAYLRHLSSKMNNYANINSRWPSG